MTAPNTIDSPHVECASTLCGHGQIERWKLSDGTSRLSTMRKVKRTDPYLHGHFPGLLIWPGVFIVECARQLVLLGMKDEVGPLELASVRMARFVMPLVEDDVMRIQLDLTGSAEAGFSAHGWCTHLDGRRSAQLKLGFVHRSRRAA